MVWVAQDYLKLLEIVFIPSIFLILVFYFRNAIKLFLEKLAPRISKVQAFGLTIDLSKPKELKPHWISDNNEDLRGLTSSFAFDSGAGNLIQTITSNSDADFSVIDLRFGTSWLTSRLYVFSVLFDLLTNIKHLVFVDSNAMKSKQYIGYTNLKDVRWSLVKDYPWLEKAFAGAYFDYYNNNEIPLIENPDSAAWVVQSYINNIQIQNSPLPPEDIKDWVELSSNINVWEKARWIDRHILFGSLGHVIRKEYVVDSLNMSKEDRVKAILRQKGPLVALLDHENTFQTLIDREALLDTSIQRMS